MLGMWKAFQNKRRISQALGYTRNTVRMKLIIYKAIWEIMLTYEFTPQEVMSMCLSHADEFEGYMIPFMVYNWELYKGIWRMKQQFKYIIE